MGQGKIGVTEPQSPASHSSGAALCVAGSDPKQILRNLADQPTALARRHHILGDLAQAYV